MSVKETDLHLDLPSLTTAYASDVLTPSVVVEQLIEQIADRGEDGVWISVVERDALLARARQLETLPTGARAFMPLWGIPFSVKDCIDVAALPTTSACPAFSYIPKANSPSVERLLRAGAILIGKTNMDQFATGLVGTRSPYGVARNPFNEAYIPGGSSSGSAVSVSAGLVSFALGTDTGGSGRVPAAFNNIVGLKPTRGLISGSGTVPACRSIETISIFALTVSDSQRVFDVVRGYDEQDPFSRQPPPAADPMPQPQIRFAIPERRSLEFFGDADATRLFDVAVQRLASFGDIDGEIDYAPFAELNELLFKGAWLAERYGALRHVVEDQPTALLPLTRAILKGGRSVSGAEVFAAQQRCNVLKRLIDKLWQEIDVLVVPTTGTIYRIDEIESDPIELNFRLGRYTNFVNLADLAAVAMPAGFRSDGLPLGITLIGPAFSDRQLASIAERYHEADERRLGARAARRSQESAGGDVGSFA